jgi:gamma-glutamyltranspeptidase / glutathione hydrolase
MERPTTSIRNSLSPRGRKPASARLGGPPAGVLLFLIGFLAFLPLRAPSYPGTAPTREPVRAPRGMVASSHRLASAVGVAVLQRGGNAVDAAVAVGLALAVVDPRAGNLGGGGFSVIRMADGTTSVVDFREVAPGRANRDMYLDREANVIPEASTVGALAAGVPGTVAGLALALEKHGTLRWRDLVEPARRLALDGFRVSHHFAADLRARTELLERFPESQRIFLRDGQFYREGDTFRQQDLARTLRRLQEKGPGEFYGGRTAELIVRQMEESGGLITLEDLERYRPILRQPVRGTYRGYEVLTMPPPSSGGAVLIEMLNILEQFDLRGIGHNSPEKYHILAEAMKRAFADRAEYFGDPAFVKVPVTGLTSKEYAQELFRSIDRKRATPSERVSPGRPARYESPETTHYSVVDAAGNAVSTTYTLNGAYGSGLTVRGAGFLLNNEMDDFTSKPGAPNLYGLIQGEKNAIAPGKRPLSSMTPTIILKDGRLFLVIGSPGGPTIINTVLQVTLNLVDHGMNLQEAIGAPRVHHQWLPDRIYHEPNGLPRDVVEALRAKGHRLEERSPIGDAQGVVVDPATGMRLGASDPRNPDGRAAGY